MKLDIQVSTEQIVPTVEPTDSGFKLTIPVLVQWSYRDDAYVGTLPFVGDCCHSVLEHETLDMLKQIAESWILTELGEHWYELHGLSVLEPATERHIRFVSNQFDSCQNLLQKLSTVVSPEADLLKQELELLGQYKELLEKRQALYLENDILRSCLHARSVVQHK